MVISVILPTVEKLKLEELKPAVVNQKSMSIYGQNSANAVDAAEELKKVWEN